MKEIILKEGDIMKKGNLYRHKGTTEKWQNYFGNNFTIDSITASSYDIKRIIKEPEPTDWY